MNPTPLNEEAAKAIALRSFKNWLNYFIRILPCALCGMPNDRLPMRGTCQRCSVLSAVTSPGLTIIDEGS